MFSVSKIQANLYGVVGLRQPLNPTYAIIDADNLISRSGEFVTANPYCKVEFLKDNQDYAALSDANFNLQLKQMQQESIISVCHSVFNKPDYIDRQVLYPYAQNRVNPETMPDGFVCHKIKVSPDKNIAFEITRVLLDFQGTGDIELRLFNTANDAHLFTTTITIGAGETHKEVYLNWIVDNSEDTYKGDYYIGYRNNTVGIGTLTPWKRDYENSNVQASITHLCIDKFVFPGHAVNTLPNLLDQESIDQATGLNMDITVYDDVTDLITQNEKLFARAILLDMQIKCIEMYMASLRSNLNERESNRQVLRLIQVVEGANETDSGVKVSGLKPKLSRAIHEIQKQIDKLQKGYLTNRITVDTLE